MYAYNVDRPDHFANLRKEAAESYRGMTAIVSGKPYLVVDREKVEYVLEGENGEKLWMEGGFDYFARTEHNALIAASRVHHPFAAGNKLGDWEFGRLAYVEGQWYVRNGATDQVVPIEELTQLLEDNDWYAEEFLANFKVHGLEDKALEAYMPEVESGSNWVLESLPNTPLEFNLDSMTIFADRRDYDHWNEDADRMWWEEEGKHPYEREYDEVDWEGGRIDAMMEEAAEEGYADATEIAPDALSIPYNNSEAARAYLDGYQSGRSDAGMDLLTPEEYKLLLEGTPDTRDSRPWGDAYSNTKEAVGRPGQLNEMGLVYDAQGNIVGQFLNSLPDGRWVILNANGRQEVDPRVQGLSLQKAAAGEDITPLADTPKDIPFDPSAEVEVVHAYEDGDIVDVNGKTTFNPEKAYAFLIGQHEFDTAEKVKQLIDRSPPAALPDAVIPPDQAMAPQTELPAVDPSEAPLDPTGGQGAPGAPASGGPVQPATQVPPMPGRPAASVKESYGDGHDDWEDRDLIAERPMELPEDFKECQDCGGQMRRLRDGMYQCTNCGVVDSGERGPYQDVRPDFARQPRANADGVEFFTSKEARKDYTHSEQKALINENLEGRARNYDKLNLKGTHYELENESSLDDFLWQ